MFYPNRTFDDPSYLADLACLASPSCLDRSGHGSRWRCAVRSRGLNGLIGIAVAMALVLASVVVPVGHATPARAEAPSVQPAAGQFYGARTRVMNGVTINAGATATVQIAGVDDLPATGLASAWLNVASRAMAAGGNGALTVYPSGASVPAATGAQYQQVGWNQDLLLVKVGSDGKIMMKNQGAGATAVKVYIDVYGYTLTSPGASAGSSYVGVTPARLANEVTVAAGGSTTVEVLGKGGVPASGVSHVAFTLTANSTGPTKLVAHASGSPAPTAFANLDTWTATHRENLALIPVGADGKVTITNIGTYPSTILVDVSGYYASPSATLAGSVTHAVQPARYGGTVNIPSDGSYTLSPLGANGIPASGVTAVALNLTMRSTSTGFVRVYPSGEALPPTRTATYPDANLTHAGFIAAKLGSDGKLVIKNWKNGAVTVTFDVYAYFSPTPSGCAAVARTRTPSQTTAGAPAKAARADADPEPYNPTTVFQASPNAVGSQGILEFAYTDGIGRLMHGRADPGALGSLQWTPIHEQEGYYGQPALGEQADGRLNVLAHNLSGDVWSRTQATKEPAAWGNWVGVQKPMGSTVTVARLDNTLVAFAVDAGGALWALPQHAANDPYKGWIGLGVAGLSTATAPLAVPVAGGLKLFFLDASGTWRTALYVGGIVSSCAVLSGPGFSGNASVVTYPGSRLRIFVRGADGHVLTKTQDGSGAFPQEWDQVGDLVAAGSPSALISPRSGKTEVVVRGADGRIHSTGETVQGTGEWRAWADAQPDASVPATDPTAFQYVGPNGPTWSYIFRTINQEMRLYWPEGESLQLKAAAPTFKGRALPKPPPAR
ncbi:hypothetical protein [Actinomadura sp. 1N219]|uniref:hypothetical protein n=1 Tax=Actinomadura sp. 1N219 TaxID=3375152 RepID=UPI0037C15116